MRPDTDACSRPLADLVRIAQTCLVFDPLFPVALFCGPLALAFLVYFQAKCTTRTFWPAFARVGLALVAVWGLTYWGLMIAIGLFGEGMNESGLYQVTLFAMVAAMALVAGTCGLVAKHRA